MFRNHWVLSAAMLLLLLPAQIFAQSTAFQYDIRGDGGLYSSTPSNPLLDWTFHGPVPNPETLGYTVFGLDFDANGTLFAIDNDTKTLGTVDPITSEFTTIAPISGAYNLANTNVGLDVISPTQGYMADTNNLFSIDLTTGVTTLIGSFGLETDEFAIDISSDSSGNLYAFVIFNRTVNPTDNGRLYSVNTSTAATTLIGTAGIDNINFAQGMDFDPDTDLLYVAFYTGGGTGTYGTWNTANGSYTEILNNSGFPEEVELEIAIYDGVTHGMNNRLGTYVTFPVSDPLADFVSIPQNALQLFAMDFDAAGTTLYAIDNSLKRLGTINLTTGEFTVLMPVVGDWPDAGSTCVGITCDASTGQFYLSDTTTLFTLDITTGDTVLVADYQGPPLSDDPTIVIELACNEAGDMYIFSSGDDKLWSVDKTTGACAEIGVGPAAGDFIQGMDFDPATGELYASIYVANGTGFYGTWDTNTGAFTSIVALEGLPDQGDGYELKLAIQLVSGPVVVVPTSLDVSPGILNAGGLPQLAASDNMDLNIFRDPVSINAVTQFVLTATSPTLAPTTFDFTLEGNVISRPNVVQRIELFNYVTGLYEILDERNANRTPSPDLTVVVSPTGDLSRFVNQTTGEIQARVRYRADIARAGFASNTDQTVWTIE